MRGATRIQVITIQALAGAVAAGALGLLLGTAWPWDTPWWVAVVAALLDVVRVAPPAMRTQVPAYWGRIFDARTVALLYGARLGIGPLTILPTWLWWAALLLGAAQGPWPSALVGATFAIVRTITSWAAGEVTTRRGPRDVHALDAKVRLAAAVVVTAVALAACSGDDGEPPRDAAEQGADDDGDDDVPTIELEPTTTTTTTPETEALDDLLLTATLDGFERDGGGPLDLEAAAETEVDPEAERALLETRGFVAGVERRFSDDDQRVVYLASYEFRDAGGAAAYLVDGAETLTARDADPFDVPLDGAVGFTTVDPDGFTAHAVAYTRDARWFLVLVGSPDASLRPDAAIDLATRQAA